MINITHYKTPVCLSNVAKVTRTKTENVTQALWNGEKVTSVSIKWPHKDSFDQELAVWRILVFRHHLMIQTASRQSLSAFTLAYCWRISPVIEECVLWSRPVRRGLMATASRHGSYWHRASKTACKHLHCYELWSWWLMHQSQFDDVVDEGTAGPLLNSDLINNK